MASFEPPPEGPSAREAADGRRPLPSVEAGLVAVGARLTAIEQTLREFEKVAWALLALASRSPVHLDVDRLEVDRLEFRVENVDVGELSGELNIGLTSMFKPGGGEQQRQGAEPGARAGAPTPAGAERSEPGATAPPTLPPSQPIWPPPPADNAGGAQDQGGDDA